jgi:hypothetical protein
MSTFNPIFYYNIQPRSVLNASLFAVYKFEGNGNDSLGVYNATTIGSGVTFTIQNAVNGLAMQTANSVNTRISLPINTFSFTTGTVDKPFSIKANIRMRGTFSQQSILSKYNGTLTNASEYYFYVRSTNQLAFLLFNKNAGGIYIGATTPTPILINTNYNVVVTYDGSGLWTGIKIYINGVSQTLTSLSSAGTYIGMRTTTLIPTIGNSVSQNNPFIGMIDELYVFNGAITQAQVNTLQTQYYPNF